MNNEEWEQLFALMYKASEHLTSEFFDRLAQHGEDDYVRIREYIDKLAEDFIP
jgi:hypothetical protein